MEILGIDVGKHEMHAVLLQHDRSTSKSVPNSAAGIKQLQSWLRNRKVERVHACLEATGGWSEDLALALYEAGHVVSLGESYAHQSIRQERDAADKNRPH